jgi:NagD protein
MGLYGSAVAEREIRSWPARLRASGLEVPEERIWTSALATAGFLEDQRPGGSVYAIGWD